MKKYNVAVVGATGLVGQTFLKVLKERNFPVEKLYLYASARSAGKIVNFDSKDYTVIELKEENIKDTDTYADRAVVGIKQGMERMGMEVETQKGSGEFIGETMPYVTVRATDNGNTAYQKIVFLKVGNYVAEITSYADSEEGASKYIDMFTKLEK